MFRPPSGGAGAVFFAPAEKKKGILSDALLGALEEIRTPDLLIRSQTLYPTELPAQVQDIYYHRHRGLSTVFAKKFKNFFAKQKRFFCPLRAAAGGPFFRPQTDCLLAPPCARGCPRVPWDAPCALGCPLPALGVSCALCGGPHAPCVAPRAPWIVLCALECPHAPLRCPLRALGLPYTLRVALRASVSLAAHRAPQYRARLSPAPRRSSPPPRRTAEKKPGRSKRSGRALFISLSGDEAQVSDQALGLPNWQSLLPESEVHISSMFRGSL